MTGALLAEIRAHLARHVETGFGTEEEMIDCAVDRFSDRYPAEDLESYVARLVEALLAAHRNRQHQWGAQTDCDRLDNAFADLERSGIVARQHFTDCQRHGQTDIWDEINPGAAAGTPYSQFDGDQPPVYGYVFYDMQDTERACAHGVLYLDHGALDGSDEQASAVGWRIIGALRRAGLPADWNGSTTDRIRIPRIQWRRRRQ